MKTTHDEPTTSAEKRLHIERDRKLITCVLHRGKAVEIVKLLYEEKGVVTENVSSGRASGMVEPVRYGDVEVDILTVVVFADRADEIFEYIYDKADIGRVFSGFIYQGALGATTLFALPDVAREDHK